MPRAFRPLPAKRLILEFDGGDQRRRDNYLSQLIDRQRHACRASLRMKSAKRLVTDSGLCAFLILKDRYLWIAQLDERRQNNFREFARD